MKTLFISGILFCLALRIQAQCSTIGQTPSSAFPVCGVDTFAQTSVPLCSSHNLVVPGCSSNQAAYSDLNPFWYTFTCYASGTLGFLINPKDLGDDYDWELYDITNHNPNDVFTDNSLVVAGNWCGTYGLTGASDSAKYGALPGIQCASNPADNLSAFAQMPTIKVGHKYLLLISHFTQTQSGYQLIFREGTASISDPNIPKINSVKGACNLQTIGIKLTKQVRCNTLAPDGSDFLLSPSPVSITGATGEGCDNGFDMDSIVLQLSDVLPAGNFNVAAQIGTDGNTVLDDCYNNLVVGDNGSFVALPIISAQISYQVFLGCKMDSIQFSNDGKNGITKWQWTFDSAVKTSLQDPLERYSVFGNKTAQLIVSNGVCADTAQVSILLDNSLKAGFTADDHVCPEDPAPFTNTSIGNIVSWRWDFGDGTVSSDSMPLPHNFPQTLSEVTYTVKLIVENAAGCYDTAKHQIIKVRSCYIDVPSAFTPNGDSHNDYLYPLNAYKATNLEFRVYNRYGQLVFETKDWTRKWDGTIGGKPQPTGTYVWMLEYTDSTTGKKHALKGTSVLIR